MLCQCQSHADLVVDGKCLKCSRIAQLEADNARLREALEEIEDVSRPGLARPSYAAYELRMIAREALRRKNPQGDE